MPDMDIHVYKLSECGFYARGKDVPEFGFVSEWLTEFSDWVASKGDVSITNTFDHPDGVPRRVYCADTVWDERGDFGVALWNESPTHRRGIAYLPSDGQVGEVRAQTTRLSSGSIAGWPTYLWFMPERSVVVCLSPENFGGYRGSGIAQAREYFRRYLEGCSSYAHPLPLEEDAEEHHDKVYGYRKSEAHEPDPRLKPKFTTTPLYGPGPLGEILQRWTEIRKVIKSYTVTSSLPQNVGRMERVLDVIMADGNQDAEFSRDQHSDRRRLRVESDWRPRSRREVELEIEEWEREAVADNYWVGVYFEGDNKIRRFDKQQGRRQTSLEGSFAEEPLWRGEDLVRAWSAARGEVEDLLRARNNEQEVS